MSEETPTTFPKIFSTIVIIFLLFVVLFMFNACITPSDSNNPSIYDDDWQRDNYGGTEHYE
ncbi:hypothetical protein [Aquibacillus saliphilus]|uniref:hypothetical protein n=1 Tax=Aquibacillus saliphilus TaxID=1909422 RepID=UPI001CF080C1|nr:hypothetical protein [Aquibacillus saliphilus]